MSQVQKDLEDVSAEISIFLIQNFEFCPEFDVGSWRDYLDLARYN
jgi:hypothetical protein